jgi:hypothetical protein
MDRQAVVSMRGHVAYELACERLTMVRWGCVTQPDLHGASYRFVVEITCARLI